MRRERGADGETWFCDFSLSKSMRVCVCFGSDLVGRTIWK